MLRDFREGSSAAFQVSWAEYSGDKPLGVTADGLKNMATNFGQKRNFGDLVESTMGLCRFGSFGTAVFRSAAHPPDSNMVHQQSSDHIIATHICDREPVREEVSEAQWIANRLALGPDLPTKPN